MKNLLFTLLLVSALHVRGTDLILCGLSKVRLIDPANPNKTKWQWQASDSPSIPVEWHGAFRSTDECKPYAGGLLLVTSSSRGVALIERKTKRCRFFTLARNAHSACLLPQNQIVVAASHGGDEMRFYRLSDPRKPAQAFQAIPLDGAHGAVWDAQRKCLWSLGTDELLRLQPDESGKWSVQERWKLPSPGGHDLSPRDDANLYVSSNTQVFLFNRDRKEFTVHQSIGAEERVKSVDRNRESGSVVYHKGTPTTWWSDTIRFLDRKPIRLPGERLYKVRWDLPIPSP